MYISSCNLFGKYWKARICWRLCRCWMQRWIYHRIWYVWIVCLLINNGITTSIINLWMDKRNKCKNEGMFIITTSCNNVISQNTNSSIVINHSNESPILSSRIHPLKMKPETRYYSKELIVGNTKLHTTYILRRHIKYYQLNLRLLAGETYFLSDQILTITYI